MRLLTCKDTSKLTRLSERSLERLRISGEGPPFIRLSQRRIAYREDDVLAWIEARRRASRAEDAEARSAA
jgi:predicted DNA-binding transcriptional regulator AlpA